MSNGRVNIKSTDTSQLFKMYDRMPVNECVTFRGPTEGLWNDTQLSYVFFSQANIQQLQNSIRAGVFHKSNGQYTIGPQDCDPLKVIMRSIFLQYSANQVTNVTHQVEELNKMVLDYSIKQVYSEAQGYIKYLFDASTLVVPIAHPVMADSNDKTLEFKTWF
tara:strand:- start:39 stop:524 length:486 start_codon:yes stop_codon:yes gene_type:complete